MLNQYRIEWREPLSPYVANFRLKATLWGWFHREKGVHIYPWVRFHNKELKTSWFISSEDIVDTKSTFFKLVFEKEVEEIPNRFEVRGVFKDEGWVNDLYSGKIETPSSRMSKTEIEEGCLLNVHTNYNKTPRDNILTKDVKSISTYEDGSILIPCYISIEDVIKKLKISKWEIIGVK